MSTEFLAPIRAISMEYDMLPRGSTILCALSGGRDSMALLHALAFLREPLGFSLCAAHFNHKLRGAESERDEAFVAAYCHQNEIPQCSGWGDVRAEAERRRRGIEETARSLRYAFLEQAQERFGATRIATAHHADDNLETLLLRLARGTGLRGLCGIPPVRGSLIRPLLTTTRASIEDYVRANEIPFVEDSSNEDKSFARNRLRHEVLPILRDLNPNIAQLSAGAICTLREDEVFLEAQAAALFREARCAEDGMVIEASRLSRVPRALGARIVRRMLEEIEAPIPGLVHINGILLIAGGADPAAAIHLPGGVLVQRVYADLLIAWDHRNEPLPPLETVWVNLNDETVLGDWCLRCRESVCPVEPQNTAEHLYLAVEALEGMLQLRARQTGDELALLGRRRKSLKKLMIEEKIPRRDRERIPILADGKGVVAVAGLGADRSRLAEAGAHAYEMFLTPKEKEDRKDT